jgi:hypothetical protein
MGRCTVRPVNSIAIRKQVVTIAQIIESGLSQANNVKIRGTNIVKLFCPEAYNVLIDAEGVDGMGSQASHVTDVAISHGQTAISATSSSPIGLIGEMVADGIPASGAMGVTWW